MLEADPVASMAESGNKAIAGAALEALLDGRTSDMPPSNCHWPGRRGVLFHRVITCQLLQLLTISVIGTKRIC